MSSKKIFLLIAGILIIFGVLYALSRKGQNMQTNSQMLEGESDSNIEAIDALYYKQSKGFFAKPKGAGSFPAVVMVHEWWGLNQNIKDMAKELAREGYMVLAVDLYNGRVAAAPEEAQKLVGALNQDEATANMRAAAQFLKNNGASKLASLGWCFGGGQSLKLALSGEPLDATVIYYGNLTSDKNQLAKIKWPVLGIFGEDDQAVPVSSVRDFEAALDSLNIQKDIHIYPGVGHAFANPSGANYAPNETKDAWAKTLAFLGANLK